MRVRLVLLLATSLAACGIGVVGEQAFPSDVDGGTGASGSAGPPPPPVDADEDAQSPPGNDGGSDATAPDANADAGPGAALSFAAGRYVSMGAVSIPTDFTLEAWVRPKSHAGERYVIAKDRSGQGPGQCRLGFDATGHLFFIMSDSGGSDHGLYATGYVLQSTATVPLAVWSHVAVTKSGAAFTLYIDGVQAKTATANASFAYGGAAIELRVAARVDSNGTGVSGAFDGAIDEVRIWKVARTQAQIAAARGSTVDPTSPSFADLTGYWRFDEGAGTTTADVTGAHAGILVGGPTWITTTPF